MSFSIPSIDSYNHYDNVLQNRYTPGQFKDCLANPKYIFPPNPIVEGSLDFEGDITLPDGLCVEGDLTIRNCTSSVFSSERLFVEGYLALSGCSLTSLPQRLRVRDGLFLCRCIGLISLPQGLYVGGDLKVLDCTSFVFSSDVRPFVGGDLAFSNCSGLASLPPWMTQLGLRSDGRVREVYLTGTGLAEEDIKLLKTASAPGMQFFCS